MSNPTITYTRKERRVVIVLEDPPLGDFLRVGRPSARCHLTQQERRALRAWLGPEED